MEDKYSNEIKVGQNVHFSLKYDHWDGEVIKVDPKEEKVEMIVTRRATGVGLRETLNCIECSRYIVVLPPKE